VVCTTVSTDGMFPEHKKNIFAVDEGDASAFALGVVEMYTSQALWETVRR